jgi:hypothetical protein
LPLEAELIPQVIAFFAQPTELRLIDVLAAIGTLCTRHAQQRRTALDVLTLIDVNRRNRTIARRVIFAMLRSPSETRPACSLWA